MAERHPTSETEIIPYLFCRDVPAALDWLTRAFGFTEDMRVETPRGFHAEMTFGGRRIMMGQGGGEWRMRPPSEAGDVATMGVFIYLPDVDTHYQRARDAGAKVIWPPHDESYGRTYAVRDLDGHPWFFTSPKS